MEIQKNNQQLNVYKSKLPTGNELAQYELSIRYGDFIVTNYNRVVAKIQSNGGTVLVIREDSTGITYLFRDSNNDDILDEVIVNFEQACEEVIKGKDADDEYGRLFRAIQEYLLDNILVCTLPTSDENKFSGTHLFIPQREIYLC